MGAVGFGAFGGGGFVWGGTFLCLILGGGVLSLEVGHVGLGGFAEVALLTVGERSAVVCM